MRYHSVHFFYFFLSYKYYSISDSSSILRMDTIQYQILVCVRTHVDGCTCVLERSSNVSSLSQGHFTLFLLLLLLPLIFSFTSAAAQSYYQL